MNKQTRDSAPARGVCARALLRVWAARCSSTLEPERLRGPEAQCMREIGARKSTVWLERKVVTAFPNGAGCRHLQVFSPSPRVDGLKAPSELENGSREFDADGHKR